MHFISMVRGQNYFQACASTFFQEKELVSTGLHQLMAGKVGAMSHEMGNKQERTPAQALEVINMVAV